MSRLWDRKVSAARRHTAFTRTVDVRDVACGPAADDTFEPEPETKVVRHAPRIKTTLTRCGVDTIGIAVSNTESGVNCPECLAEIAKSHAAQDKRLLARLKNAKVGLSIREITRTQRYRLETKKLAEIRGAYVVITPAGLAAAGGSR